MRMLHPEYQMNINPRRAVTPRHKRPAKRTFFRSENARYQFWRSGLILHRIDPAFEVTVRVQDVRGRLQETTTYHDQYEHGDAQDIDLSGLECDCPTDKYGHNRAVEGPRSEHIPPSSLHRFDASHVGGFYSCYL